MSITSASLSATTATGGSGISGDSTRISAVRAAVKTTSAAAVLSSSLSKPVCYMTRLTNSGRGEQIEPALVGAREDEATAH